MNKLKRILISLSTLMLFSGVAMVAPVSARAAVADDNASNTSTDSSNDLKEQFQQDAQDRLQTLRQNHKEQTQEHRQQACEARKSNLQRRMTNAVAAANRHKEVFDKIYTRVKDFYTNKNLNVTNYADLTAAVDKAQTDAQSSIDALSALDVNVDCTSQTVAGSVATFQTAVKSTRDSLKAYRSALVDLIKSLKGASTGANGTTDNSNTNETNQ